MINNTVSEKQSKGNGFKTMLTQESKIEETEIPLQNSMLDKCESIKNVNCIYSDHAVSYKSTKARVLYRHATNKGIKHFK